MPEMLHCCVTIVLQNKLPDFPVIVTTADICRDELLFEIERLKPPNEPGVITFRILN